MRVVHVITGLGQGGAEAVLYRLVETPMTGCEHVVISLTTEGVYGERLRALGIPVHALHMRGLADLLGVVRRLVRLLRSLRPDVIQTWMYHADLVGGIAAKLVGKPVVWGVHHSSLEKKYTKRSTRLVAGALARISHFVPGAIVSCSVKATGAHVDIGYSKRLFRVIPNGVDVSEYRPDESRRAELRARLGIASTDVVFCSVARFDPQKDHRNLIEAFFRAFPHNPDVCLVMCGSRVTADNAELMSFFPPGADLSRVHLLGSRDDVPWLLAASDYFVLSSLSEAFPCVLVEAMAAGLPCVVTDVGDSAEIVEGSGWVAPPRRFTELAKMLEIASGLSGGEREAAAERARSRAVDLYDIKIMREAYKVTWNSVC